MKKQLIEYPCEWSFRIIGSDEQLIQKSISECLCNIDYSLVISNTSKNGKYISFNLETFVQSEGERNELYIMLKKISSVKMVL